MFKIIIFDKNDVMIKANFKNTVKTTIVILSVLNFQPESTVKNLFFNAIA